MPLSRAQTVRNEKGAARRRDPAADPSAFDGPMATAKVMDRADQFTAEYLAWRKDWHPDPGQVEDVVAIFWPVLYPGQRPR